MIGEIPSGVDGLQIDLIAGHDLDIELWEGEVFVVGWQVSGQKSLVYSGGAIDGPVNGIRPVVVCSIFNSSSPAH